MGTKLKAMRLIFWTLHIIIQCTKTSHKVSCGWTVFGVMIIILYSIYYVRAICARVKMSLNKSLERMNVIIDNVIVYLNNQCMRKKMINTRICTKLLCLECISIENLVLRSINFKKHLVKDHKVQEHDDLFIHFPSKQVIIINLYFVLVHIDKVNF